MDRWQSAPGRLARLGFGDPEAAARLLAQGSLDEVAHAAAGDAAGGAPGLLDALARTADPDLALRTLARLVEALDDPGELLASLHHPDEPTEGLLAVLGASAALGDHLVRHPQHWRVAAQAPCPAPTAEQLRADLLGAVGAERGLGEPVATAENPADALRVAYRRRLVGLAARDLTGAAGLDEVAAELADLAGAALEASLAVARAELPTGSAPCRLAVVAMGKCGGRELNYVSDVDVVFVAEAPEGVEEAASLATATRLASGLSRVCSASTPEGTLWPVDAALRPEGRAGPLVRTLASHLAYYQRWAKTWEFQALLKARPVAGDLALGQAYARAVAPLVWQAAARENFVTDVHAMRRRVEGHVPVGQAQRQIKLGPGGLRDVEFAVQLLQLVHGRADPALRSPTTLVALAALAAGGYVGRADAAALAEAYRFLRSLEHRLQLHRLRRTHVLPEDPVELRRLGRSLGMRHDPVVELEGAWQRHAREVRRLHEKLFYRPLLHAVARLDAGDVRLSTQAARSRLEALGYLDPAGALRHIEALTAGVSRRAAIQRTLLPVMLGWFADAPDPDEGLLAFRRVSEALGATPWYLRLLRDEGQTAERMARLLASSRFVTDLLLRAPEAVQMLAGDEELTPRPKAALVSEVLTAVRRNDDPVAAAGFVRTMRRRELFRVAAADLLGLLDRDEVGPALAAVTSATLCGALEAAARAVRAERRGSLPTRIAVIGMGRLGGHETGYGSDADVLFVHEPDPGVGEADAADAALAVATELRRLLALPSPEPPLPVDADLRPEGRQGPLVRTLGSYAAYYHRWGEVWERQALLRAEPVAGDAELAHRFVELIDPLRYPAGGLDQAELREVRRIKARVEAERLPRGADPAMHFKLGPGGLADVEWTVQLLQLRHAATVPGLRCTGTLPALRAAAAAGLVTVEDAEVLTEAWRLATRLRNAVVLSRGRTADALPADLRDRRAVALSVGYPPEGTGRIVDDYRRATRRARAVVDRIFYQAPEDR